MSTKIYYLMIIFGIMGGTILYFQNTIINRTLYSPFGPQASSVIILISIGLGVLIGYGINGLFNSKKDDYDDSDF